MTPSVFLPKDACELQLVRSEHFLGSGDLLQAQAFLPILLRDLN